VQGVSVRRTGPAAPAMWACTRHVGRVVQGWAGGSYIQLGKLPALRFQGEGFPVRRGVLTRLKSLKRAGDRRRARRAPCP